MITLKVNRGDSIHVNGKLKYTPPAKHRISLQDNEQVFILSSGGEIINYESNRQPKKSAIEQGNVFLSHDLACLERQRRTLEVSLLDFIEECNMKQAWICSWSDEVLSLRKFYLVLNAQTDKVFLKSTREYQHFKSHWYGSEETMNKVIETFSQEDLRFILTGERY